MSRRRATRARSSQPLPLRRVHQAFLSFPLCPSNYPPPPLSSLLPTLPSPTFRSIQYNPSTPLNLLRHAFSRDPTCHVNLQRRALQAQTLSTRNYKLLPISTTRVAHRRWNTRLTQPLCCRNLLCNARRIRKSAILATLGRNAGPQVGGRRIQDPTIAEAGEIHSSTSCREDPNRRTKRRHVQPRRTRPILRHLQVQPILQFHLWPHRQR